MNLVTAHILLILLFLLTACGDNQYIMQSIKGHFDLMSRARPIEQVLEQDEEPEEVRQQLATVLKLRDFAVNSLHLPDSGSYQKYADLERPYAVWNMVAAPELSLDLYKWCFPVVGCVTYRGYFEEQAARTAAKYLSVQGFDVDVYGVQAYSTLNWFDDPVLNTFLQKDDIRLASLLFHEMAHQVLYVPGDSLFNESFAKTVELEGLRRWFSRQGTSELWQECQRREKLSMEFQHFLAGVRAQLNDVYGSKISNDEKRIKKDAVLLRAYADYERLKKRWNNFSGYDEWISAGLNNARLSSVGTYFDYVPAFQELLRSVEYDLQEFYTQVKAIADMTEDERVLKMTSLAPVLKVSLEQDE